MYPVEQTLNGLSKRTHQAVVILLSVGELLAPRLLEWRNQPCVLFFQMFDNRWRRVSQIAKEGSLGYFRLLFDEGFRVVMRGGAEPPLRGERQTLRPALSNALQAEAMKASFLGRTISANSRPTRAR